MEGTRALGNTPLPEKCMNSITVLVVDEDAACSSIVSSMLKSALIFKVVAVRHPNDALHNLRVNQGGIDLVLSDVHMPDMDGYELQQIISKEFDVPVVLMSADERDEEVALKGLENGAAFFILKPISSCELRYLWQFAYSNKKSKTRVNQEISIQPKTWETNAIDHESDEDDDDDDDGDGDGDDGDGDDDGKKDSKGKPPIALTCHELKRGGDSSSSSKKKRKVVWSNTLHNRFLEAIRTIGLDRAVPKKIVELMDVPGLTRENVASHLQKYRIFLRRIADATDELQGAEKGRNKSFTTRFSSLRSKSSATSNLSNFTRKNYENPAVSSKGTRFSELSASYSRNVVTGSNAGQFSTLMSSGGYLNSRIRNGKFKIQDNGGLSDVRFRLNPKIGESSLPAAAMDKDIPSPVLPPGFDMGSFLASIGVNIPCVSSERLVPKSAATGAPSKNPDVEPETNYVGYRMPDLRQQTGTGFGVGNQGMEAGGGMVNFPVGRQVNGGGDELYFPKDMNINNLDGILDEILQVSVPGNGIEVGFPNGVEGSQTQLPTNPLSSGVRNGGEIYGSNYSQLFNSSELEMIPSEQMMEDHVMNSAHVVDQMNFQTQHQQVPQGLNIPIESGSSVLDKALEQMNQEPNIDFTGFSLEFDAPSLHNQYRFPSSKEIEDERFVESLLAHYPEGDCTMDGFNQVI